MATVAGSQPNLMDAINALIELDFDAVEAYQAAIDRLSGPDDKRNLAMFKGDHERHTRDLAEQARRLGGEPKQSGDFKAVLTKGKVILASISGPKAILTAMRTNEDDTNKAYENAVSRTDLDEPLREVLHKNLSDERRHRAWIVQRLAQEETTARPLP